MNKKDIRPDKADGPPVAKPPKSSRRATIRETVESVVVAFVLAFLFRTFEAEAFVIPTGSMAPTLMGRHKDLECVNCGFPYRVNASDETNGETGDVIVDKRGKLVYPVISSACPNCRYRMTFDPNAIEAAREGRGVRQHRPQDLEETPTSFTGDRIIVAKFPYDLHDPRRWDVAVFKYPHEAKNNFIKRVTGLPGEILALHHGDLFNLDEGAAEQIGRESQIRPEVLDALKAPRPDRPAAAQIARKPPHKLAAMLQVVYDNDYVLPQLHRAGWPLRFAPEPATPAGWQPQEGYRAYAAEGDGQREAWLRYQHVLPPADFNWQAVADGAVDPRDLPARPQLIGDLYAYNDSMAKGRNDPPQPFHWVGDLAIECELSVLSDDGEAMLELREGSETFQCRFQIATGDVQLVSAGGLAKISASGTSAIRGQGTYEVRFANADDQLYLWVDGDAVEFDQPTTYGAVLNYVPHRSDLAPASIGVLGAKLRCDHLRVLRDVYYIAGREGQNNNTDFESGNPFDRNFAGDIHRPQPDRPRDDTAAGRTAHFLSDPAQWSAYRRARALVYRVPPDSFFMCGDNSPRSSDGRLWDTNKFVHRDLLIGKAVFIYWPHALEKVPGTEIPFPFFPNFGGMKFVH